jgi:hypothetical protein
MTSKDREAEPRFSNPTPRGGYSGGYGGGSAGGGGYGAGGGYGGGMPQGGGAAGRQLYVSNVSISRIEISVNKQYHTTIANIDSASLHCRLAGSQGSISSS